MTDVTDLPEEQLNKSYTYCTFKDRRGVCSKCLEPTSVLNPCCGAPVRDSGREYSYEELWQKIDDELFKIAEPDPDNWIDDFYEQEKNR